MNKLQVIKRRRERDEKQEVEDNKEKQMHNDKIIDYLNNKEKQMHNNKIIDYFNKI